MILDRLTLEHFRLHRHTDLTFGLGLTAVVGANGAGKSTLLEAVTFALFGEQRGTKETLRAGSEAPYRVRLAFTLGVDEYVVERRPDRASLTRGERKIAEGLSDTTRACTRLLGLSYEQFRNSFLAEQKALAFLRFRNAAARQEEVARMLGFDRLRRAEALAAEARRASGAEARALAETVGDEAAIRAARNEAAEAVKAARTEVRVTKVEAERAQHDASKAEPEGRAAEAFLSLSNQAASADAALRRALEDRGLSRGGLERARREAAEAVEVAPGAQRHAEAIAALPTARAAALARKEAEELDPGGVLSVTEVAEALKQAQAAWRREREARVAEQAAAREAVASARRSLSDAEQGEDGAPCPVCGRPLGDEAHAWREELGARVAAAEARLAQAEGAARAEEPEELKVLANQLRAAELRAQAADAPDFDAVRETIQLFADDAARAKALAGSERRLRDADDAFERSQKTLTRADEAERQAREALQATGITDAEEARVALARAAAARASAAAAQIALQSAENALSGAQRALDAAESRLNEAKARTEALRAARHAEALHAAVASEMRSLRAGLNSALRPELEHRASELLERLTTGRYRRLTLSPDFEATLIDEEAARAVISGGEEDIVALALRIALAELIGDRQGHALSLLMLDEAFGSLDVERRQSLLDVLVALRDRYQQVIVVSHVEDVAQVADRVLRVSRDSAGFAQIEEV